MLKLLVIGNLGKDAVVNTLQSGQAVINFSVAHTENYKDRDGNKQQKTQWVDCAWWTDKHAIVPYLKKGTQVYLEGQPEVKTFNKNDGGTGVSLVLRVLGCNLLSSSSNGNGGANANASSTPSAKTEDFSKQAPPAATVEDELPF
jgi:single-strand DNA-binding protein